MPNKSAPHKNPEITVAQRTVLVAIYEYQRAHKRPPTWRNLAATLDRAPTTIRDTVARLARDGYVNLAKGEHRGVSLTPRGIRTAAKTTTTSAA